jgi:hypothetical protein
VTEAEWLAETDAAPMLEFLSTRGAVSDRKLRLFACACCRFVWPFLRDERGRNAVAAAERYSDGHATFTELYEVFDHDDPGSDEDGWELLAEAPPFSCPAAARLAWLSASDAAASATTHHAVAAVKASVRLAQCSLLRDSMGNPFRPAPRTDSAWLRWQDGTVSQLARAAYDDRQLPEGTLDATNLALLADALEDAGCPDAELLGHLRSQGPHVRGCWAVDLLLAKS